MADKSAAAMRAEYTFLIFRAMPFVRVCEQLRFFPPPPPDGPPFVDICKHAVEPG